MFHNDGQPVSRPLVTMFGASNELPEGKELEAFFDRFEDELFDKAYGGESDRLPAKKHEKKLDAWADAVREACEQLPAFSRLASECRGDAMVAGTAVERLMRTSSPSSRRSRRRWA